MRPRDAVLLAGLLACSPFVPEDAMRIHPDSMYRVWYGDVAQCAGLRATEAQFQRIRWYIVPGNGFECPSGECAGRWNPDHSIYLSERYQRTAWVVMHEELHDLRGDGEHPSVFDRCNLMP